MLLKGHFFILINQYLLMQGGAMGTDEMDRLPVVVIGAGPIGLAAAVHLVMRGEEPLVLEAGDGVGTSIRKWSHVALFSSWKYLMDPIASRMLESQGWRMPDPETAPTGGEFVERYLEPLAALPEIASRIQLNARATAVSRRGYDKVKSAGRDEVPFELTSVARKAVSIFTIPGSVRSRTRAPRAPRTGSASRSPPPKS
ncbi:hypothetical protein BH23GEM8_BH23GEM8_04660 [soil metagenome]